MPALSLRDEPVMAGKHREAGTLEGEAAWKKHSGVFKIRLLQKGWRSGQPGIQSVPETKTDAPAFRGTGGV